MSKWRLIGLTKVEVGLCITTTYRMTTTFTTILNVIPGTAKMALPVPAITDYLTEDSDYPDVSVAEAGESTVEFATRDMLASFFSLGMGGTAGATVWKASTTAVGVIERSLKLTSKAYQGKKFTIEIPRAELSASAALNFSNKGATEPGSVAYQATVLIGSNSTGYVTPIKISLGA